MIYIYLDVLIVTNIYVTYFLIRSTARISHTAFSGGRCVLSSLIGAASSLMIFLPTLNFFLCLLMKVIIAFIIIVVAFGIKNKKKLISGVFLFFIINFAYSGIISTMWHFLRPSKVVVNNYQVYFDIDFWFLAIMTIVGYIIICVLTSIFDKKCCMQHDYKVLIEIDKQQVLLDAVCDTGNSLSDTFSGRPVVICNSDKIRKLLNIPDDIYDEADNYLSLFKTHKGARLLPYNTISNNGMIIALPVEKLMIKDDNNDIKAVDALVGIGTDFNSNYQAIFNPCLLT